MKTWKKQLIAAVLCLSVFVTASIVRAQATVDLRQEAVDAAIQKVSTSNTAAKNGYGNLTNTVSHVIEDTQAVGSCNMLGGCVGADGSVQPGAVTAMTTYIADMYRAKPASTQIYVADALRDMNINISQPAYAQGLGFASLDPILAVWKVFRNLAYLGFVIIFLVIGFMIMFRQKIGSQTVVGIQQALPNIIVAMIAVTFSYAIAGLLIDLMYLLMGLIVGVFSTSANLGTDFRYLSGSTFDLGAYLFGSSYKSIQAGVGGFVEAALGGNNYFLATVGGTLAGVTAIFIFAIVIVIQTFKLFFALLRVYLEIILGVAFAPIILMFAAIPGNKAFSEWIRNLVGNLAVFPAILVMVVVFTIMKNTVTNPTAYNANPIIPQAQAQGFMPPYIIGGAGSASRFLPFLAALALISALAELPDATKKAIGVKQGGFIEGLLNKGVSNFSQGATYLPPVVGAVAGGTSGAVYGAVSQRKGGNRFVGAIRGARYGIEDGLQQGNSMSRVMANLRDGKLIDPNAWERYLVESQVDKSRKERRQKEAERNAKRRPAR